MDTREGGWRARRRIITGSKSTPRSIDDKQDSSRERCPRWKVDVEDLRGECLQAYSLERSVVLLL